MEGQLCSVHWEEVEEHRKGRKESRGVTNIVSMPIISRKLVTNLKRWQMGKQVALIQAGQSWEVALLPKKPQGREDVMPKRFLHDFQNCKKNMYIGGGEEIGLARSIQKAQVDICGTKCTLAKGLVLECCMTEIQITNNFITFREAFLPCLNSAVSCILRRSESKLCECTICFLGRSWPWKADHLFLQGLQH